jgi:hypothetical protein
MNREMGFGNFKLEKNTWSAERKTVDATLFGSPSAVSCDDASAPRSSNNCSRGVPCGSPRCLMGLRQGPWMVWHLSAQ